MKETIKSWLIANLESISAFFLVVIIFRFKGYESSIDLKSALTTFEWIFIVIVFITSFTISILVSSYTYKNFNEVVSRRMLWRNSNVTLFNERLKYSINRMGASFICVLIFAFNIYMFF